MGVHFMGLALIVGTVGILDLRIMGFIKQVPVAPVHRFVPWALAGLGVNIVTGMMAFIGQPLNYVSSGAFWLKMIVLLLLGLNAAVFYMTDVFEKIEHLKAGEDAPMSAKLVAASTLALVFGLTTVSIMPGLLQTVSGCRVRVGARIPPYGPGRNRLFCDGFIAAAAACADRR